MEYLLSKLIDYIAQEMTELSLVDEDYGQLEAIEQTDRDMYPLNFPAVLIEPSRVDWSYVQSDSQKGTATLRIRLIVDCYDDTHAGSSTTLRIIEREELRHKLHSLLDGYRPLGDGGLMRTQSTFFTFKHGIKVYEAIYTCTVTEYLKKETVNVNTPPRLSLRLGHL